MSPTTIQNSIQPLDVDESMRTTYPSLDSSLSVHLVLTTAYRCIVGGLPRLGHRSADPRVGSALARIQHLVSDAHVGHAAKIAHLLDEP